MSGAGILMSGIVMTVFAVLLFIISIIYKKTVRKRILEELKNEYE